MVKFLCRFAGLWVGGPWGRPATVPFGVDATSAQRGASRAQVMRLFVGVWPSVEVVRQLERIDRPEHPAMRWTTPSQWHVTLRFLGEVDRSEVPLLTDALRGALRRCPRRTVTVGPATERLGRRTLVVPVDGVGDLAIAVGSATGSYGDPPEDRPFAGHLTLARGRGGRPVPAHLAGEEVASRWVAEEVVLACSHLDASGARYEPVATMPLSGGL